MTESNAIMKSSIPLLPQDINDSLPQLENRQSSMFVHLRILQPIQHIWLYTILLVDFLSNLVMTLDSNLYILLHTYKFDPENIFKDNIYTILVKWWMSWNRVLFQPSSIVYENSAFSVWFLNMFHLLTNENTCDNSQKKKTCETKRKKILILGEEKNSEDKND